MCRAKLTLNDYLVDYRIGSVYVFHVARVVVAVGPLKGRDRQVTVISHLHVTVPRLYCPVALQPLPLGGRLPDRCTRQSNGRPPRSLDQTAERNDFRGNYFNEKCDLI